MKRDRKRAQAVRMTWKACIMEGQKKQQNCEFNQTAKKAQMLNMIPGKGRRDDFVAHSNKVKEVVNHWF